MPRVAERRRADRLTIPSGLRAEIRFDFPEPGGHPCSMKLRDVSPSGLSFELALELPGLQVGDCLQRAVVTVGEHTLHGDLLVMHVTPANRPGAVCGALLYPQDDSDIRALQQIVSELGGEPATAG